MFYNETFQGLNSEEARNLRNYLHFRNPTSDAKMNLLRKFLI